MAFHADKTEAFAFAAEKVGHELYRVNLAKISK